MPLAKFEELTNILIDCGYINSLTAIGPHDGQRKNELRARVVSP